MIPRHCNDQLDFTATPNGWTGDGPKSQGIVAAVTNGSYIINDLQQKYLRNKLGPQWKEIMWQKSGQPAVDPRPPSELANDVAPTVLHGKEMVVGPEAAQWIQRRFPKLEKVGMKAVQ